MTKFPLLTYFENLLKKFCLLLIPCSRKSRRKRYPEKRAHPRRTNILSTPPPGFLCHFAVFMCKTDSFLRHCKHLGIRRVTLASWHFFFRLIMSEILLFLYLDSYICMFLPGGGGVHNMLRVWVCAAHMGGFLGPKFSKQGFIFRQISHKQGWVIQKLAKNSKKWMVFLQKSS